MRKRDELTNPNGCMFRARDDEMTFVLLSRDAAAPVAIRAWIHERIRLGKNEPNDPQIVEAMRCAEIMEAEQPKPPPVPPPPPKPHWRTCKRDHRNDPDMIVVEGGLSNSTDIEIKCPDCNYYRCEDGADA